MTSLNCILTSFSIVSRLFHNMHSLLDKVPSGQNLCRLSIWHLLKINILGSPLARNDRLNDEHPSIYSKNYPQVGIMNWSQRFFVRIVDILWYFRGNSLFIAGYGLFLGGNFCKLLKNKIEIERTLLKCFIFDWNIESLLLYSMTT